MAEHPYYDSQYDYCGGMIEASDTSKALFFIKKKKRIEKGIGWLGFIILILDWIGSD